MIDGGGVGFACLSVGVLVVVGIDDGNDGIDNGDTLIVGLLKIGSGQPVANSSDEIAGAGDAVNCDVYIQTKTFERSRHDGVLVHSASVNAVAKLFAVDAPNGFGVPNTLNGDTVPAAILVALVADNSK